MFGVIVLAALLAQPEAIPQRLPPVENCSAQAGLDEFRAQLKGIAARKDEAALLAVLAGDVEVNFGGDRGPALFAANWKFADSGESHVWNELRDALSHGCAASGDAWVAPSFVTQFPEKLDAFETVILPPGTQLRRDRSAASAGDGAIDWHLASIVDDRHEAWINVKLVDGRQGFVRREEVVNPLDYRLVLEKRGGKWMITAFVAGD